MSNVCPCIWLYIELDNPIISCQHPPVTITVIPVASTIVVKSRYAEDDGNIVYAEDVKCRLWLGECRPRITLQVVEITRQEKETNFTWKCYIWIFLTAINKLVMLSK